MHRLRSAALCAALLLTVALAACGDGSSSGSSAAPAANRQTPASDANAQESSSGTPVVHWAPDSGASAAN
ncbi:hypothetical protein [Paraburkholderia sp.]|uniref:hypothetical protein n=1 Tax=Paraburkholderia sp. TaxID=1926495 RepID=UPI002D46F977|nr:hypothetical protein [Paraburkholderia sp.]HZZ02099.1 hypothetical protein [Paraburkholderia sp.]